MLLICVFTLGACETEEIDGATMHSLYGCKYASLEELQTVLAKDFKPYYMVGESVSSYRTPKGVKNRLHAPITLRFSKKSV